MAKGIQSGASQRKRTIHRITETEVASRASATRKKHVKTVIAWCIKIDEENHLTYKTGCRKDQIKFFKSEEKAKRLAESIGGATVVEVILTDVDMTSRGGSDKEFYGSQLHRYSQGRR